MTRNRRGKQYSKLLSYYTLIRDLSWNIVYNVHIFTISDVPQPPADIQAEVLGSNSVRLQWPPSDRATSYIVEYNLPFPDDAIVRRVPTDTTSATIDGLQPNSEYAFRVRALNDAGPGELSRAVVARTIEGMRIFSALQILPSNLHEIINP